MMEAAPAASLVMSQAEFLFQLLVIALDPPTQFGQIDQAREGHVWRESGQPIFGGLGVTLGPPGNPARFSAQCRRGVVGARFNPRPRAESDELSEHREVA